MTYDDIAKYAGDVVAVCAVIAALWKPPTTSAVYPIYAIISALGANVMKAKNDPMVPPTGSNVPER